jgi:predicted Zn-dependent protease
MRCFEEHRMRSVGLRTALAFASLGLVAWLAACATNPVTGRKEFTLMTEQQELELGRQAAADIEREMPRYRDERLQRYVEDIGMRLARASQRPRLPWQFTIVDVPAVNAFALPGGYVYITRGILPYLTSEAELAAVLGHEIGHVAARHSVRQYTKSSAGSLGLLTLGIFVPSTYPFSGLASSGLSVLFLKYSREDEIEADGLGAEYAASEGWDPHGIATMLSTLSRLDAVADRRGIPNWLSTHPNPEMRVTRASAKVEAASAGRRDWAVNQDGYLERIDGLLFGDNPDEGVVRDNQFLHPAMRIAMEFPLDWPVNNGQEQVVAKNPSTDEYVVLQLLDRAQGKSLQDVARQQMSRAGWKAKSGAPARVNALEAWTGVYDGSVKALGNVTTVAEHVAVGRRVFLVAGVARRDQFEAARRTFDTALQSFRELSSREASAIRPNVVALYTAVAGDSWQSIAARQGKNIVRAATLAIMNGHAVSDQPKPGERIKIVAEGS